MCARSTSVLFFFLNDPATTEIYTLPLHDALPISRGSGAVLGPYQDDAAHRIRAVVGRPLDTAQDLDRKDRAGDRKSTRLNSSHLVISYAVFCLKKKKTKATHYPSYHRNTTIVTHR